MLGDINGNGIIDIGDAFMAFRAVLGITLLTDEERRAAVLDGTQLTIAHARRIYLFARGLSSEL
jgi:hypothetical protein